MSQTPHPDRRGAPTSWDQLIRDGFGDDLRARATDWAFGLGPALEALGISLFQVSANTDFSLLDYGCGRGGLAIYAKTRLQVGRVCGVDTSPTAIALARARSREVRFEVIDAEGPLPYPPGFFDGCLLCFVLCTMATPEEQLRVLRHLHRILKPGGRLAILANAPTAAGRRYATVQVEATSHDAPPGSEVGVRLFDLGETHPYLEFTDYAWPPDHYLRLTTLAGFDSGLLVQPTWNSVRRWVEEQLLLPAKTFPREREQPPFVLYRCSKPRPASTST